MSTFLISFSVKALWLLIKESQEHGDLDENEQPGIDFARFKQNLAKELVILKDSGLLVPELEQIMNID